MDSHSIFLGAATRTTGEIPGGFILLGTNVLEELRLVMQEDERLQHSCVGVMGKQLKPD